ncbi:hypothetical protein RB594_003344 [Gaeumannomyces avenae]
MLPKRKREGEGAGHSGIVTMLPPRPAPAAQQKVMLSIGDYNAPHARLASFWKNPHPWPHARPAPEDLAAAGFFFDPYGIVTGLPPGMGHFSLPMSPPTGEEEDDGDAVGGEDHPPHPMDSTTCPSCELSVDGDFPRRQTGIAQMDKASDGTPHLQNDIRSLDMARVIMGQQRS